MNKRNRKSANGKGQSPWAAIDKVRSAGRAKPPEEAFTTADYGRHYDLDESSAKREVARMFKAGALVRIGRLPGLNGVWYKAKS